MTVQAIKHIEDCFDGSFIKEIVLSDPITQDFILYLGTFGKLQYYKTFARPFFKVVKDSDYEFKGVEGNLSIRVLLKKRPDENLAEIRRAVNKYSRSRP